MKYICPYCGKNNFTVLRGYTNHVNHCKQNPNRNIQNHIIVDDECPYCHKHLKCNKDVYSRHLKYCKQNPNRVPIPSHSQTVETKQKISESMKRAHQEGRAYSFMKRDTSKPSVPEQFFIKMLKNEFGFDDGKDYIREVYFHGFFLDFCWPDRKLVIEVDGAQHEKQKQKERDKRKDALLKEEGWTEIRLDWSFVFNNTKYCISELNKIFEENKSVQELNFESFSYKNHRIRDNFEKNIYNRKSKEEIYSYRKYLILNSGVDLMDSAWIEKVSKVTGLTRRQITFIRDRYNIPCF